MHYLIAALIIGFMFAPALVRAVLTVFVVAVVASQRNKGESLFNTNASIKH